jgi:hypothetical protein
MLEKNKKKGRGQLRLAVTIKNILIPAAQLRLAS